MNNFKKLLASAMALSMVTSVMPTYAADIDLNVCSVTFTNGVEKVMNVLEKAILAQVDELEEVKLTTKVDWQGVKHDADNALNVGQILEQTIEYGEGEDITLAEAFEKLVECGNEGDYPVAEYLGGYTKENSREDLRVDFAAKVNWLEYNVAEMTLRFGAEDAKYDFTPSVKVTLGDKGTATPEKGIELIGETTKKVASEINGIYEALTDENYTAYLGSMSDDAKYLYDLLFDELEEYVGTNFGDTYETALNEYVVELLKKPVVKQVSVEALVKGTLDSAKVKHGDYKTIETFIKNEKKTAQYKKFADADEVVDIFESLEAIAEDAKSVDEFIKPINSKKDTTYRALYVTKAEWNDETKTTLADYLKAGVKAADDKATVAAREAAFDELLTTITTDEMDAVIAYVEEITNEFYTVGKVERSTGTYNIKFEATSLATYLDEDEVKTVQGLVELLLDGADNKSEVTYYELLVEKADAIKTATEAISTGIKNITINNLNSKNAAKVVEANDALAVLKGQAKTTEQARVYNKNAKNVEVLYNFMLYNGIVTVEPNGWVDLGNGDWDYYVEGKAFTGWVCSAKDVWYYVRDGHMLRNAWVWRDNASAYYVGNDGIMVYGPTTVNGYALDANGLWHA